MSLFNRPAWATAQSEEDDDTSENIFSHSSRSYAAIVAEEQRKKKEREQKQRIKLERNERRSSTKREVAVEDSKTSSSSPKRRRITLEEGDDLLGSVGLSPSLIKPRGEGEGEASDDLTRRRSPRFSKVASRDDARFAAARKPVTPAVIELGSAPESEDELQITHVQQAEPEEQESDDEFAELARQARARNKLREDKKSQTCVRKSPTPGQDTADRSIYPTAPAPDPPVKLLITSRLDGTKPLMVYRKLSQRLQEIRQVWCDRQGLSKDFAEGVYLVHRMRRVFDVTTCRSLGLDVDAEGNVTMKDAEGVDGVDQVHLEAVTDEIFAQIKAEKDREERKRQGLQAPEEEEAQAGASETPAAEEEQLIRILLTSKERKNPFKLKVKLSTAISKIMMACKPQFGLEDGQSLYLDFDGERLEPDQMIQDTEITDMDRIDVHII